MTKQESDMTDVRWGGYIPWFLRHKDFVGTGNFLTFFDRLSQCLDRLFTYNEAGIPNLSHFGDLLETKSFRYFRHDRTKPLSNQIKAYFAPETLNKACSDRLNQDQDVKNAINKLDSLKRSIMGISISANDKDLQAIQRIVKNAERQIEMVKKSKKDFYYLPLFRKRFSVLEILLRILPNSPRVDDLISEIRRFFAESEIMLDIKGSPPLVIPIEEQMLQQEIIDNLLQRLSERFPERANELISCYHKVKIEKNLDSIFSEAFKSLEEIARSVSRDNKFVFDKPNLKKYFPLFHPTIHETMIKLAGHRGDEASHGKAPPDFHEIRYLLFSICNIALLLLDYPSKE